MPVDRARLEATAAPEGSNKTEDSQALSLEVISGFTSKNFEVPKVPNRVVLQHSCSEAEDIFDENI